MVRRPATHRTKPSALKLPTELLQRVRDYGTQSDWMAIALTHRHFVPVAREIIFSVVDVNKLQVHYVRGEGSFKGKSEARGRWRLHWAA